MKTVSYKEYIIAKEELDSVINDYRQNGSGCWSWLSPFDANTGVLDEKPIDMQINWASCGTVDLAKAEQFANELKEAIELARNFKYNGYKITH